VRTLLALSLMLMCCACAHLQVQVAVLNPAYLEAHSDQEGDRKKLVGVLSGSEEDIRAQLQPSRDLVEAQYDALIKLYEEAAKKPGADTSGNLMGAAKSLQQHAKEDFRTIVFEPTVQALLGIKAQILQRLTQESGQAEVDVLDGNQRIPEDVLRLLNKWSARILKYESDAQAELGQFGAQAEQDLPAGQKGTADSTTQATKQEVTASLSSLIGPGQSVANDINAYLVASAPSGAWEPEFNKTVVDARWGNLDTAIKLIGLGEFTIKGVTFDPSKVAQVASKVATQSLLMATQIAGVPVKLQGSAGSGGATDGAALAQASGALSDAEAQIDQQNAAARDYRRALVDIAQAILRETPQLVGPKGTEDSAGAQEARLAAIKGIQATFEAQKPRLTLPAPPTNPAPQK
jgi:hypothetical protein